MTEKIFPIPFTLPDGRTVLLNQWSEDALDSISFYIRKRYLSIVTDVLKVLPEEERFTYMQNAVDNSVKLDFALGYGRELLLGHTRGMALAVYLLIENPPFTFDQFYSFVFPTRDMETRQKGMELLDEMMGAVYDEQVITNKLKEAEELFLADQKKKQLEEQASEEPEKKPKKKKK